MNEASDSVLRLPAPAKLNLLLRIVGRKADGYHLLQTVFQFIDRCDWITLRRLDEPVIRLATPLPGVPEETDLTVRAARALSEAMDVTAGVEISIEKHLPMGGGLGGGSSDAATVLVGLNQLWGVGARREQLITLGLTLGADVPVFVNGHSAWAEGVGEHLTAITPPEHWYVVLVPSCQVATARIFSSADLTRNNSPITMADFVAGRHENDCLAVVVAEYPEVEAAMQALSEFSEPRLTGTGACVFAAFQDESAATQACARLGKSWPVFVAKGLNVSPLHQSLGLMAGNF